MILENKEKFNDNILKWWEKNHRSFKWRETSDPYKILCVEILLQRTKAEQVEEVYIKFINKFKNIYELNEAEIDEIKELIKPLGFIKRAGYLKTIANQIVLDYEGKIPGDKDELLKLKGVGNYVSHAVLCFAFKKPYGVLDTNTLRILYRFFGLKQEVERGRNNKRNIKLMNQLIQDYNCRNLNYALLDFGALICKKRNPQCLKCIVNHLCKY